MLTSDLPILTVGSGLYQRYPAVWICALAPSSIPTLPVIWAGATCWKKRCRLAISLRNFGASLGRSDSNMRQVHCAGEMNFHSKARAGHSIFKAGLTPGCTCGVSLSSNRVGPREQYGHGRNPCRGKMSVLRIHLAGSFSTPVINNSRQCREVWKLGVCHTGQ